MIQMRSFIISLIVCFLSLPANADQCKRLHIGHVNWLDVEAKTAMAEMVLEKAGYRVRTTQYTVSGNLEKLSTGDIDAFLGSWMPSNAENVKPYIENKTISTLATNLTGAKYTLAVPKHVYEAGVKSFADLITHKDQLESRIYGLESGSAGNLIIENMINQNAFGLKDFKLIPSSERIMLAQLKKRIRTNKWMVFLAWEPHPMNINFDIEYLSGGDEFFGPNFGEARVETLVRAGFEQDCPQAAKLLKNITFNLDMENKLMADISENFVDPKNAAWNWISENPEQLRRWLQGVELKSDTSVEEIISQFK